MSSLRGHRSQSLRLTTLRNPYRTDKRTWPILSKRYLRFPRILVRPWSGHRWLALFGSARFSRSNRWLQKSEHWLHWILHAAQCRASDQAIHHLHSYAALNRLRRNGDRRALMSQVGTNIGAVGRTNGVVGLITTFLPTRRLPSLHWIERSRLARDRAMHGPRRVEMDVVAIAK